MVLSPTLSWLFLIVVAVGTISLIVVMVRLEQKSSRRFWSKNAQYDDPDFIERRNAALKAAARHKIPREQ
jgi:hypothetical protein